MDAKVKNYAGWQSDVIVDMIKRYGFPFITLNPGASFRGLHDSLVNYGNNEPPMMLCNHEEIAVQIAHGYAKATGKPAAVILHNLVELAETTGSAVWDVNNALNFPNKHPLCLSMDKASLRHTDLVLGLDLKDWEKQLTELNSMTRQLEPLVAPNCDYVEIGFAEVGISKWAMDYCRMQPCSVRAPGDTEIGIPELTRICKERIAKDAGLKQKIEARKVSIGKRHDEVWA